MIVIKKPVGIGYMSDSNMYVSCVVLHKHDELMVDRVLRNEDRPSTPEGERARIRSADHLERLQMTNPDERRCRIRVSTGTEGIAPLNLGAALAAQIPQVQMPAEWNAQRPTNVAASIPQVQLPIGWDAPLANPVPVVPPALQLQTRRGRGRGRGRERGPLHNISGGQADPAFNNLHRGHIALRERSAEYDAHL